MLVQKATRDVIKRSTQDKQKIYRPKVAVTGGGSGGHVNAAIQVIDYMILKEKYKKDQFIYLGGTQGMIGERNVLSIEQKMIIPKGIKFCEVSGGKLHRFFTFDLVVQFFRFLKGFLDSYQILKQEKPSLLFSTGGFITVPPVVIAKLLGIKVIIHEQTVVSGLANRIASKFADVVCLSHKTSLKFYPRNKSALTGNPIKKAIYKKDINKVIGIEKELKKKFLHILKNRKEYPIVLLTGGAQGAHQLNIAFITNLSKLVKNFSLILQVGSNQINKDYEVLKKKVESLKENDCARIIILKFFGNEVGPFLNNADIVVSRGGANMLAEIESLGKKVLIIPLDNVSGDEQYKNAERLAKLGYAVVYKEGQFSSWDLIPGIEKAFKIKPPKKKITINYDPERNIVKLINIALGI